MAGKATGAAADRRRGCHRQRGALLLCEAGGGERAVHEAGGQRRGGEGGGWLRRCAAQLAQQRKDVHLAGAGNLPALTEAPWSHLPSTPTIQHTNRFLSILHFSRKSCFAHRHAAAPVQNNGRVMPSASRGTAHRKEGRNKAIHPPLPEPHLVALSASRALRITPPSSGIHHQIPRAEKNYKILYL